MDNYHFDDTSHRATLDIITVIKYCPYSNSSCACLSVHGYTIRGWFTFKGGCSNRVAWWHLNVAIVTTHTLTLLQLENIG